MKLTAFAEETQQAKGRPYARVFLVALVMLAAGLTMSSVTAKGPGTKPLWIDEAPYEGGDAGGSCWPGDCSHPDGQVDYATGRVAVHGSRVWDDDDYYWSPPEVQAFASIYTSFELKEATEFVYLVARMSLTDAWTSTEGTFARSQIAVSVSANSPLCDYEAPCGGWGSVVVATSETTGCGCPDEVPSSFSGDVTVPVVLHRASQGLLPPGWYAVAATLEGFGMVDSEDAQVAFSAHGGINQVAVYPATAVAPDTKAVHALIPPPWEGEDVYCRGCTERYFYPTSGFMEATVVDPVVGLDGPGAFLSASFAKSVELPYATRFVDLSFNIEQRQLHAQVPLEGDAYLRFQFDAQRACQTWCMNSTGDTLVEVLDCGTQCTISQGAQARNFTMRLEHPHGGLFAPGQLSLALVLEAYAEMTQVEATFAGFNAAAGTGDAKIAFEFVWRSIDVEYAPAPWPAPFVDATKGSPR